MGIFALALFAIWAIAFFILSFVLIAAIRLPGEFEFPFMGLMLLICLLTYTLALNSILQRVAR